jgi:3'(2'), 5'-bisphosphate nucleotidase
MLINKTSLARSLIPVVLEAGRLEMGYFRKGIVAADKSDGSPVTQADQEAEALIVRALAKLAPGIPVVGEEGVAEGRIPDVSGGTFFLIDALDGTREFIAGGEGFTVNVALMENFIPIMGIIHAPAQGLMYWSADGVAYKGGDQIHTRPTPPEGFTVLASRRADNGRLAAFLEEILSPLPPAQGVGKGEERQFLYKLNHASSSIKFCLIAEGRADIYPRLGETCEWDTAAGEAILTAAGGRVTDMNGRPLRYGKASARFLNPDFVARGLHNPPLPLGEGEEEHRSLSM